MIFLVFFLLLAIAYSIEFRNEVKTEYLLKTLVTITALVSLIFLQDVLVGIISIIEYIIDSLTNR